MWFILPLLSIITLCSLSLLTYAADGPIHRRFEYKHSFGAPDLSQRDGSILFWTITGDAVADKEQLRLAPSMRSRRGLAWNKRMMVESDHFEIHVAFRVTGQGRIGADGIGVWFTAQPPSLGPVFGANDYWTGMGIFLDSFDNDAQKNNPFVALMLNDGTRQYDHQTDGSQQMLSGCQKDFRNKPYPVHLKIEYLRNVLTVSLSDGLQVTPRYELCIRSENIFLPKNGYFGISAATGGLADDHDIITFSVFSLYTDRIQTPSALPQEEKQKYDAEFERQMQEYEKERQRFKEQHPEKAKPETLDEELAKIYEDAAQRELRLIFEMQANIHQMLHQLERRLQDISKQQNAQFPLLQQCVTGAEATAPGQMVVPAGGFQQHEKNEALQALRDLTVNIQDMRSYVNEIFTRTHNIEQKLEDGNIASASASTRPPAFTPDQALRSLIETIQNDVRQIRTTQLGIPNEQVVDGVGCANISCLSSSFFMTIIFLQSAVIMAAFWLKRKPDKAKFY